MREPTSPALPTVCRAYRTSCHLASLFLLFFCSQSLRPSAILSNIHFDHSFVPGICSQAPLHSALNCLRDALAFQQSSHSSSCYFSSKVQCFPPFVLLVRLSLTSTMCGILDLELLRQTSMTSSSFISSGSFSRHRALKDILNQCVAVAADFVFVVIDGVFTICGTFVKTQNLFSGIERGWAPALFSMTRRPIWVTFKTCLQISKTESPE